MVEQRLQCRLADGKTALTATKLSMLRKHIRIGIPGAVDNDRAIKRVIVGRIKAYEAL